MTAHIDRLAFCGMRRLHMYEHSGERAWDFGRPFHDLRAQKHWFDFARVNVVIGPNGGGKSTLLDMIGTLADPALLCTLPREFPLAEVDTAFILQASNLVRLECRVWPTVQTQWKVVPQLAPVEQQGVFLHIYENKEPREHRLCKAGYNLSKFDLDQETRMQVQANLALLDCVVVRWDADTPLGAQDCATVLNEDVDYLDGVCRRDSWDGHLLAPRPSDIITAREDGRLMMWLDDDLLQPNSVQLSALPAGWRRYAALVHWLQHVVREGAVCLLEEPEIHLHPRLQRRLARRMYEIATKRNLQLFVSTHAPALIHGQAWSSAWQDVVFLEATGGKLRVLRDGTKMLDALGIRGSDIYQSNGVIWVEGPSDRLYLRHWMNLWCQERGVPAPREHIDYSFQFYGGAVLAHYSVVECQDFISMLRLNRNMVLMMDRDNDFAWAGDGAMHVRNPSCAKARIWTELAKEDTERVWITAGYTTESELNPEFIARYCDLDGERLLPRSGGKVALALRYIDECIDLSKGVRDVSFIGPRIAALVRSINAWAR